MASSSEQDNLDFLLEEETDTNNCSNTEDGVQKDVPLTPLPALQPVNPNNLINLNLTQLLALLQNSIQKQSNIDPSAATLSDPGQNKTTVDSTGENLKENEDNDDEEDELLQNLTQEFECQEEKEPPIHKKLEKILQGLLWGAVKKEKLEKIVMDTLPPKNLKSLERTLVNPEIWRNFSHKTKSVDLRLQEIQKLVLKSGIIVAKIMNLLYEAKQNQEASMLEVTESCIRLCADTAMLIGQTNFEILNFRRAKRMPELNYSYRQLSFDQGDHPKLLFVENLPKQIKDISETNKVGFAISRKSSAPSNTISISPHNSPQNKIQPSFLYAVRRASKGRPRYMQSQSYPYHQNYRKQQSQWYQSDNKNYN